MSMKRTEADFRDYDRARIKSGLFSLFWAVIADRRKHGKYTMKEFADAVGRDKSAVSRWFSDPPNYRLETAADIASALGVDLEFRARDRATGRMFTPSGPLPMAVEPPSASTDSSTPRTDTPRTDGAGLIETVAA
jgi:transcriptional regulator with XRE-family HTH domain